MTARAMIWQHYMASIFTFVFYQPIFNVLVALTTLVGGNIGWSIILITIAVRLVLYPLTNHSLVAQQSMKKLQPQIDALKKKHGENKEAFSKELMGLYKEHKVNPFSSCGMVLVQLPILWALYRAFRVGLSNHVIPTELLYSFVHSPAKLYTGFLGINLAAPSAVIAVVAGFMQFLQARSLPRTPPAQPVDGSTDEKMTATMNKQMMYVFPILTVVIGLRIPAGLSLYWAVSTFLLLVQQVRVFRRK